VQDTLHITVCFSSMLKWTSSKLTIQKAPVLKQVDIKYGEVQYNGSFFHEQIYRKDPSPEVDKAWKDLGVDCTKFLQSLNQLDSLLMLHLQTAPSEFQNRTQKSPGSQRTKSESVQSTEAVIPGT
jgi:hypothetical protein